MAWVRFREHSLPEFRRLIEAVPVEVGEEISRSISSHSAELQQPGTCAGRGPLFWKVVFAGDGPLIHGPQTFPQRVKTLPG